MDPATEALSPPSDDRTPPPRAVSALALRPPPDPMPADRPTPETVLRAVVEAGGPWFPSGHAKRTGVSRADLDDALAELLAAGLVRVATWEKGVGQGFVPTPDGERVAERISSTPPAAVESVTPALAGLLDFRPPLVTPALIGANILWYAFAVAVALRWGFGPSRALGGAIVSVLERVGAVSAADLLRGEWWRLVTCAYVHVGFWHLALNMVLLGTTGPAAELFWGRWRALMVYLIAGVAASTAALAHRPLGPADAPIIVAGASGAIWGLMGAVLAWYVLYKPELPADLAADMGRRLTFAFLLNGAVCLLPQVSWEGHLAGGLAGFASAGLLNAFRFNPRPRKLLAGLLLAALPVGCVAGLVAAMRFGDEWVTLRARPAPRVTSPTVPPPPDPNVLLEPVRPEAAQAARWAAVKVWLVGPEYRNKARRLATAEIDTLARRVGAAAERLAAAGDPVPDARTTIDARIRELDRLRELVNGAEMPTVEEWKSWGDSRREADRPWVRPEQP